MKGKSNFVGDDVLGVPFINKIKRVFGTGEVSENSSLEKLIFLKLVSRTVEDACPYKQYIPFIESFLLLFFKKEEKNPNTNYLSTIFPSP